MGLIAPLCPEVPIIESIFQSRVEGQRVCLTAWLQSRGRPEPQGGGKGGRSEHPDYQKVLGIGAGSNQAGADEPPGHVHERQLDIHLPHYDGGHDGHPAAEGALLHREHI